MNNREENDRCSDVILRVKRRGFLIVRLKAIEFRGDIFFYLSSYFHCSFFDHLIIITSIHCIIESSNQCGNLCLYWETLLILSRHWIVRKPLNHQVLELLQGGLGVYRCQVALPSDRYQVVIPLLSSNYYPKVMYHFSLNAKPHLVRVPRWWWMLASIVGQLFP